MTKLTPVTVLVIAFLGCLSGTGANSTDVAGNVPSAASSAERGREDFFSYCASCHGVEGRGDGTVAEFLTIAAADLAQLRKKYAGQFPRARLADIIDGRVEVKVHGERDMPVWGAWFADEAGAAGVGRSRRNEIVRQRIDDLISYIETIQRD